MRNYEKNVLEFPRISFRVFRFFRGSSFISALYPRNSRAKNSAQKN